VCGAWSVDITSIVPSAIAAMIASLSASSLIGGFILKSASSFASSLVNAK